MGENNPKWVAGCMSGTSLDGVDIALIKTDGQDIFERGASHFEPFSHEERAAIQAAMGFWDPADDLVRRAAFHIENAHLRAFRQIKGYDIIGFHGQTLAHDPKNFRTHQTGDGARLSRVLGRPVLWNFREHDVKAGGQGAPLAPFYHHAVAREMGLTEPVAFLNLGGVGNITFLDPRIADPMDHRTLLAFDTGPANAPINDLMMYFYEEPMDRSGRIAMRAGGFDTRIMNEFLDDPYFLEKPPKSLDRNHFNSYQERLKQLPAEIAIATASEICVASIKAGLGQAPVHISHLYICGGGRNNLYIINRLNEVCDIKIHKIDDLGLDGDMLEAEAFGYLAMRVLQKWPISQKNTTGIKKPIWGGRLSLPD